MPMKHFFILLAFLYSMVVCGGVQKTIPINVSFTSKDIFRKNVFLKNNDLIPDYKGKHIEYYVRNSSTTSFFTPSGLVCKLATTRPLTRQEKEEQEKLEEKRGERESEEEAITRKVISTTVDMNWIDANPHPVITGLQMNDVSYTYLKNAGNHQYEGVSTTGYKQVVYEDLYPGIDVQYTIPEKGGLEYNFIVHPGADMSRVKMKYSGEIKKISKDVKGNITIHTDYGDIIEHAPVSFQDGKEIASAFTLNDKEIAFSLSEKYYHNRPLTVDPWITNMTTLTTSEVGYSVDYDIAGNLYVYGGAGSSVNELFSVAKYNYGGGINYTFGGNISSITWASTGGTGGEYDPSNFSTDKGTGKVYIGQGAVGGGTEIVRLNAAGGYDNFESTLNPDFVECWGMVFDCANSNIIIGGGSWSDDINIGVLNPATTLVTQNNFTGITTTIRQDIACLTQDAAGNTYVIFSPPYFTAQSPPTGNYIYKCATGVYNANLWGRSTGYSGLQEFHNHPTFNNVQSPGASGGGFNCLAVNDSFLYYYNGKILAAYHTTTGLQAGSGFSLPAGYDTLMQGGIAVDDCNHVYVGGIGRIKCYTFNGSMFLPGTDILLGAGLTNDTIYDVRYNKGNNMLYIAGVGFTGIFTATPSISCVTTAFQVTATTLCDSAIVVVHQRPVPSTPNISYIWYDSAGAVVQQTTGTSDSVNVLAGRSRGMYIVNVFTNLNCTSNVVSDTVYIGPHLTLNHQDTTICPGDTVNLSAIPNLPGGTYTWTPGGATTSSINVWPAASTNYIVTYNSPTCGPTTDTFKVTVVPTPTLTMTNTNICLGDSVMISGIPSVAGGTFSWSPGGQTRDSFRVSPTVPTNYILTYTAPHCGVVTDTAHVTPITPPTLSTRGDTVCGGDTVYLSASASIPGGTYTWLPYGQTGANVAIPSGSSGEYYVMYDLNGCIVTDSTGVLVTPAPNAGPDQNLVIGSYAYMNATPAGGTWSALSTNPVSTTISNSTYQYAYMYGFTTIGRYGYVWTVNGCTDTVWINIVNPNYAGPNDTICLNGTVTMAAQQTSYGGYWTFISGPTTPSITSYYLYNTTVTGFTVTGTYYFRWENYYNYHYDTMHVTVLPPSNAGANQYINVGTATVMTASGTGSWSILGSNPATTTLSNPTSATSGVSGFTVAGTYGYVWTTAGGCPDTMYIYVGISHGGGNVVVCEDSLGASVTMNANGTGTWSQLTSLNPVAATITNPSNPNTTITGMTVAGNYYFVWTSPGLLPDTIIVTVNPSPNAGPDQNLNLGSYAYMSASPTVGGTWSALSSNPGSTTIGNPTYAYTYMFGFPVQGTYGYVWTVNGCSDTMYVHIVNMGYAGPNDTVCIGITDTMHAFVSGYGGAWYFVHGPSTPVIHNGGTYNAYITGLTHTGVYLFRWLNYYNYTYDTVSVTVVSAPIAGANQTLPSGVTSATMAASGTGTWSALSSNPGSATITSPTSPTSTITGMTVPGTYGYIWSNGGGCADTMYITVVSGPAGPNQVICQYTSTVMAATGSGTWSQVGSTPALITITNPSSPTTSLSNFNVAGVYYFVWLSDTISITVTAKPNAGPDQIICQNSFARMAATGTGVWSQITGGPATCLIDSSSNPVTTITGFSVAGVYYFVWTSNGCTDTMEVTVNPTPVAGPPQTICLNNTATMAASGIGTWSLGSHNPAPLTINSTTSANTVVSGFTAVGTYSLFWNVGGCSDSTTVSVTPAPSVSVNNGSVCVGGSTTLIATPTIAGGTYSWSPGGFTTDSISVSPTSTSTYTVTYVVAGCGTAIGSGTVSVVPPPSLSVNTDSICLGSSGSLTVTPSATGGTYSWSGGAGSTQTITISPTTTTTYTVTYSLAGCVSVIDSGTAYVIAPPIVSFNTATICSGNSATLTSIVSIPGGNYSWTPGGATTANITVSPTTTTTYTLSYGIPGSVCPAQSSSGVVTVTPAPIVISNDTSVCDGMSATLWTSVNIPGGSYLWSPGGATTSSITVTPASSTTYSVTYVVAGCGTSSDTGQIVITPQPTVTVNHDSICLGGNAVLTATPTLSGGTYSWSPSLGSAQSITVSPTSTTTYTVTYVYPGCAIVTDSGNVNVTIPPTVSTAGTSICASQTATLTAIASQPGGNFSWSPGGGSSASITVSPNLSTTYTVSYSLPQSVCPAVTDTATVWVTPQPTISASGTTICSGLTATISANVSETGGSYNWSPGGFSTPSITVSPATTTTYTVSYILSTCPAAVDSATIKVTSAPVLSVSSTDAICSGPDGTATVSVNGGTGPFTYAWSTVPVSISNTITGQTPGIYVVTVTDFANCTVIANDTIGDSVITLNLTANISQISCFGYNNGLISISVANCNACTYAWSNENYSVVDSNLMPGTYSVVATDAYGCSATASYTINMPPPATLSILPADTTVDEYAAVNLISQFGPYPDSSVHSYLWTPSLGLNCAVCPSPTFSAPSGTYNYSLVVTYNQGCIVTDTVTVIVYNDHFIYVPNAFTPNGDGRNDVLQVFTHNQIRYIDMQIFDRWGELVFESQDIDRGWDGRYRGVMEEPGIFVYMLKITFDDNYSITNKGSITLIR